MLIVDYLAKLNNGANNATTVMETNLDLVKSLRAN